MNDWSGDGERYHVMFYQLVDELETALVCESTAPEIIRVLVEAANARIGRPEWPQEDEPIPANWELVLWETGEPGHAIFTTRDAWIVAPVLRAIDARLVKARSWFEPI
jgi:hypothetical protein